MMLSSHNMSSNIGDGLIEERVKVDRKRFELMLDGSSVGCDADSFFRRIMRSTNTQIMWPPKLKPGTKSKKDPHVRIFGSPNSINAAKEIIFEQLDTRRNRVTLKMDVAFTDHSHIIGKGGRSIQRVMDETGCHIHFPDSNRTNTVEKSNQVSIAGSAEGVEQSRCRIREMLPITVQFDLPLNTGLHSPPTLDSQSPELQAIQQSHGITIAFRCDNSKCSNNSYFASSRIITVAVRGARSHLFGLRQGLSVLIEYLTGFRANAINVPLTMTIDVAAQHHLFIAGKGNANVRAIMQSTGAIITMPETSGLLASASLAGSTGSLSTVDSMLAASTNAGSRSANNLAMSSSPEATTADLIASMSALASQTNKHNINLSSTPPGLDDSASLCASGLSGQQAATFMTTLANYQTMNGSNPNLAVSTKSSQLNNLNNNNNNNNTMDFANLNNTTSDSNNNNNNNNNNDSCKTTASKFHSDDVNHNNSSTCIGTNVETLLNHAASMGMNTGNNNNNALTNINRKTAIVIKGPNFESVYSAWQELLGYLPLILIFDLKEGQDVDAAQVTKLMEQMRQISILIKPKQRQNTKSIVVRGPEKDSRLLFEVRKQMLKLDESEVPNFAQFEKKRLTPQPSLQQLHQQQQQSQSHLQQQQMQQLQQVNQAQQHQHQQQQLQTGLTNQQQQELQMRAIKAILEPNLDKARNPTPYWAGLGFSKSVSEPMIKEKLSIGPLFTSNLIDERRISYSNEGFTGINGAAAAAAAAATTSTTNMPSSPIQNTQQQRQQTNTPSSPANNNQKVSSCLKLAMFLGRIGLVQYLGLFTQHDIDLEMLFSLTESDFAKLGLPYAHRRRLTIAISEVKSSLQNERAALTAAALSSTFDAAPGAERSRRQKDRGSIQEEISDIWMM